MREPDPASPLVTVVVPSYRHAPYIEACIRSIASQDYPSVQLVVVDDGSDDDSPMIVRRLGEELGFEAVLAPHRGFLPTVQDLFSRARGTYYVSMGSDDIMPPGRLSLQVAHLEANPTAVACTGQALELHDDGSLHPMPQYRSGIPQVSFEDLFLGRKELHTVSMMWRLDAFRAVGGYDPAHAIEDFPLWLKLSRTYGPIHVLPDVLTHYRVHGANLSLQIGKIFPLALAALEAHRDHPLHAKAVATWKAAWFSQLAQSDRLEAIRRLPELASFDPAFLGRLPKLFLPRALQRLWLSRIKGRATR